MVKVKIAVTSNFLEPYIKESKRPLLAALTRITNGDTSLSRIPELAAKQLFTGAVTPIPEMIMPSQWDVICDARGAELLKLSETAPLVISWSGGIDSTVIVAALLRSGFDSTKHDITVFCTMESVKEYPSFFYHHILPNFKVTRDGPEVSIATGSSYFVTGEPGDQLFGSALCLDMMRVHGDSVASEDWEYIHSSLVYRFGEKGALFFNFYKEIVDYAPFKIKTVEQFWWWWNFSQKWNHVLYRTLLVCPGLTGAEKLICFFDTPDFQIWAMHNAAMNRLSVSREDHKLVAKQYIAEYVGDDSYLVKAKYPSLSQRRGHVVQILAINNSNTVVNPVEYLNESWKI